jgi:hypothetical protein
MESIVKLILLIGQPTILLGQQINKGIFFTFLEAVILGILLKDYTLILDFWIDDSSHFLKLVINRLPHILLDIVEHIVQVGLDLLDDVIDLVFFVILAGESRISKNVHIALDLVVDVIVGPDAFF